MYEIPYGNTEIPMNPFGYQWRGNTPLWNTIPFNNQGISLGYPQDNCHFPYSIGTGESLNSNFLPHPQSLFHNYPLLSNHPSEVTTYTPGCLSHPPGPGRYEQNPIIYQHNPNLYPPWPQHHRLGQVIRPLAYPMYPEAPAIHPPGHDIRPPAHATYPQAPVLHPSARNIRPPAHAAYPQAPVLHPSARNIRPPAHAAYPQAPAMHPSARDIRPPAHPAYPQAPAMHPSARDIRPPAHPTYPQAPAMHPSARDIRPPAHPAYLQAPAMHPSARDIRPPAHPAYLQAPAMHPSARDIRPPAHPAYPQAPAMHPSARDIRPPAHPAYPQAAAMHPSARDIRPPAHPTHPPVLLIHSEASEIGYAVQGSQQPAGPLNQPRYQTISLSPKNRAAFQWVQPTAPKIKLSVRPKIAGSSVQISTQEKMSASQTAQNNKNWTKSNHPVSPNIGNSAPLKRHRDRENRPLLRSGQTTAQQLSTIQQTACLSPLVLPVERDYANQTKPGPSSSRNQPPQCGKLQCQNYEFEMNNKNGHKHNGFDNKQGQKYYIPPLFSNRETLLIKNRFQLFASDTDIIEHDEVNSPTGNRELENHPDMATRNKNAHSIQQMNITRNSLRAHNRQNPRVANVNRDMGPHHNNIQRISLPDDKYQLVKRMTTIYKTTHHLPSISGVVPPKQIAKQERILRKLPQPHAPTAELQDVFRQLANDWSTGLCQAMRSHYETIRLKALRELESMENIPTKEQWEQAQQLALKWTKSTFKKKLTDVTVQESNNFINLARLRQTLSENTGSIASINIEEDDESMSNDRTTIDIERPERIDLDESIPNQRTALDLGTTERNYLDGVTLNERTADDIRNTEMTDLDDGYVPSPSQNIFSLAECPKKDWVTPENISQKKLLFTDENFVGPVPNDIAHISIPRGTLWDLNQMLLKSVPKTDISLVLIHIGYNANKNPFKYIQPIINKLEKACPTTKIFFTRLASIDNNADDFNRVCKDNFDYYFLDCPLINTCHSINEQSECFFNEWMKALNHLN
jgi:hypothetical protein